MQESEMRDLDILANRGAGEMIIRRKGRTIRSGIAKSRTTGKKITGKIASSNVTCGSALLRLLPCSIMLIVFIASIFLMLLAI